METSTKVILGASLIGAAIIVNSSMKLSNNFNCGENTTFGDQIHGTLNKIAHGQGETVHTDGCYKTLTNSADVLKKRVAMSDEQHAKATEQAIKNPEFMSPYTHGSISPQEGLNRLKGLSPTGNQIGHSLEDSFGLVKFDNGNASDCGMKDSKIMLCTVYSAANAPTASKYQDQSFDTAVLNMQIIEIHDETGKPTAHAVSAPVVNPAPAVPAVSAP